MLAADFPDSKPFFAGAYLQEKDYADYADRFMSEYIEVPYYSAKDAALYNAAAGEGEWVTISSGGWVRWDAVDFGDGSNRIDISFRGNPGKTGDQVSVIIGESLDTGKKYNTVLRAGAPDEGRNDTASIDIGKFSGRQTVYLQMNRRISAKIGGLSLSRRGSAKGTHAGECVYGGEFDNLEKVGNNSYVPTPVYSVNGDTVHPMVKNTYGGTVLRYDNVNIGQDVNKIRLCAASAAGSSGGKIQIRIGSSAAAPVASYTTQDTGWDTYTPAVIALADTIKAGTYNIYVTFEGVGKTCNFYTFGFFAG